MRCVVSMIEAAIAVRTRKIGRVLACAIIIADTNFEIPHLKIVSVTDGYLAWGFP